MQVHDELIVECPASEREQVERLLTEEMEQAVAALLLDMEGREAAVKSVTRGDTSVPYAVADGQSAALAGLTPWRRLGRLKEG